VNFRPLGDCLLWAGFSKFTKVAKIVGPLLCTVQVMNTLLQEMGWATFWVIFSQTHLVTLAGISLN
jgi:hypothetical protein